MSTSQTKSALHGLRDFLSANVAEDQEDATLSQLESEHLRAIVNGLVLPVVIRLEKSHTAIYVNTPYRELAGIPEDLPDDQIPRGTLLGQEAWAQLDAQLEHSDEVRNHEVVATRNGRRINLVVNVRRIRVGNELALLITAQDVTQQRDSLVERHKLAAIVEASDAFIGLTDLYGRPRYLNPAGKRLLGIDQDRDISTLRLLDFCPPDDKEVLRNLWRNVMRSDRYSGEFTMQHFRTGEVIPTQVNIFIVRDPDSGTPIANAILAHDIREQIRAEQERKELQDQMLHSQKLEGLGVLAGGIAHDFNNLLMAILGNTSLALSDESLSESTRPFLENVQQSSQHAAELTSQILNYAGKGLVSGKAIQLQSVIEEMWNLILTAIGKNCSVDFLFDENLPAIYADPTQIRQVVMNLMVNASDAIEERGIKEGKIVISLRKVMMNEARIRQDILGANLSPGEYVELRVEDNGIGVDEETLQRIFEPFFTTKFTGRGLGLASVYGIIKGHDGGIFVTSEKGEGTRFQLSFPVTTEDVIETGCEEAVPMDDWSGVGTVLVVDDEEPVRYVCKLILEQRGLNVLTAVNGVEAISLYDQRREDVDVVLLDMMMPQMSGDETLKRLREIDSEVRVVLSSGFSESDLTQDIEVQPNAFIQKPYLPEELIRTVREVLEAEKPQQAE